MKVAIEALGIEQPGGGRSATLNLLEALFTLDRSTHYDLIVGQRERLPAAGPNVRQVPLGRLPPLAARLWAQLILPIHLRRASVDLVHHVKNLTVAAASAPSIVTIYDLTILACPWLYPPVDVGYWRWIQPHALRRAERIVAISRTTARDLVRYYGLPDAKIEVIYPAASPRFTPQAGDPTAVRRRLRLDGDLIVHVGSISRKKNLPTLIRAFQRLRRRRHGVKLVLAGRVYHKGHDWEIGRRIEEGGGADDIVFTGPVSDEDLPGLYRAAGVVAFPSLHEGFGLVPIEAMACGAPIVASRAGALEEVVSDGGWLVRDNQDDCELADALERLLGDDALRRQLTQRGIQRARSFSPVVTATKTIGLYQQLAGGG